MDTIFVQFYTSLKDIPGQNARYSLGNGFSDTYEICKDKGDFYWFHHDHSIEGKFNTIDKRYDDLSFPIRKGTAYVSALFIQHLYRAYLWACEYPNVKFIVGGPAVRYHHIIEGSVMPDNIEFTTSSVESIFNVKNFSSRWGIDLPIGIEPGCDIYLSYTLNDYCYWNKCVFCAHPAIERVDHLPKRTRLKPQFEFESLVNKYDGKLLIDLATPCMLPYHLKNLVPKLPKLDRIFYESYIRCEKRILDILENNPLDDILRPVMRYKFGVEYPSNRMWSYLNKGFEYETMTKFMKIVLSSKSNLTFSIINGWNNLTSKDVKSLHKFLKNIPVSSKGKLTILKLFRLVITPNSFLWGKYEIEKMMKIGPFILGYRGRLNKEQKYLNKISREIIKNFAKEKNYVVVHL